MKNEIEVMKNGTTTLAIKCKDGVVLAGDKRATAGFIAAKKVTKVVPITDQYVLTTAGNVSDIQLMIKLSRAEIALKDMQVHRKSNAREVANMIAGLNYSNIRKMSMIPGVASFILGGVDEEGFHVYSIEPDGSAMEFDDYYSDGSGSLFAFGVLEAEYKKNMSVEDGIKLALRAINAAVQRDPNSGNGIDIATITDKGVQHIMTKELDQRLDA